MGKDTYEEEICGRMKTFQSYSAWARRQRNGGRSDARVIYDAVHAKSVERYKVRYNCSSTPFKSVAEFDKVVVDNDTLIAAIDMPSDEPKQVEIPVGGGLGLGIILIACVIVLWYFLLGSVRRG